MKRLALPIVLATGLLAQIAGAQTTSSTPVIGYYKFDVPVGTSAWVCGFVTKKEFQGAATSIAPGAPVGGEPTSVITQTGATFPAFGLHYVEVLSAGPTQGMILDVLSNNGTTITVKGTISGTPTYCVRKHATIGTVFASPGTFVPFSDSVTLYDDAGNPKTFYLSGPGAWVADDFTTSGNNQIIYPGQGFLIASGATNVITFGGNDVSYVKTGPTQIPLYRGFLNFVGLINPLVATQPSDPLYDLVSTPTAAGAKSNLVAAGFATSGLENFTDSILTFTQGNDLDPLQGYYTTAGGLVLDDFVTPANTATLRNGYAIGVTVENADRTLTVSQQHPSP
jgi:hypothetical protein